MFSRFRKAKCDSDTVDQRVCYVVCCDAGTVSKFSVHRFLGLPFISSMNASIKSIRSVFL